MFLLQAKQRLAEDWKHAAHFAGAAAGEDAEQGSVGGNPMPQAEGFAVAMLGAGIDGGMADIGARNAVCLEERHLERQKRHDVIDALLELARAERPPGPKLRRDVVNHRNAGTAEVIRESQAETR